MKKRSRILIALIMVISVIFSMSLCLSFAGSINGNESSVISAASGTFTFEGAKYKATAGSLNELKAYLSRDDIDLTAQQAQEAIGMMYDSIKQGVEGGNIVEIGKEPSKKPTIEDKPNKVVVAVIGGTEIVNNEKKAIGKVELVEKSSTVSAKNEDDKTVYVGELPVKNTGFDYSSSLIIILGLAVLLVGGILVMYRYKMWEEQ